MKIVGLQAGEAQGWEVMFRVISEMQDSTETTVSAQLSLKSLLQCVQGLNQQVGENYWGKNQGLHKTPIHCSNGSLLQTQGFLCKIGCEVVLEHKLSSSVMPLLIILCGSKQVFALILISFPFLQGEKMLIQNHALEF